jgi:hypothetical protein
VACQQVKNTFQNLFYKMRAAGIKNKATILKTDNEDKMLADLLERYTFWKAEALRKKEAGEPCEREIEYAKAFQFLLTKFSTPE